MSGNAPRKLINCQLLVVPNAHIDTLILKLRGYAFYVGLAIMVGKQYLWLHYFCSVNQLLGSHCVWLVAGQEGNVDVFDVFHFGNVFSIAGNVNS